MRALLHSSIGLFIAAMLGSSSAQVVAPKIENVPLPAGVDVFQLDFEQFKKYSAVKDFEILGHSYLKVDQRTPWAKGQGRPGPELGSGLNAIQVYDGIAYVAGYNFPPTLFAALIVDVRNPRDMQVLSSIPCNPGTRCTYLRVNRDKKILVLGHDTDIKAPIQPPSGQKAQAGWTFHDVSDPRNPKQIGFVSSLPGGRTHGMEMDGRYVYGCGTFEPSMITNRGGEGLQIIDYSNPSSPKQVATWHVKGQIKGEEYDPLNRTNVDGTPQIVQCHEIIAHNDRLYIAWRDAGMVILDIKDRTRPRLLANFDYVPPFHGGWMGAAHTSAPVITQPNEHPDLVVHTDEIFDCPQGFGRILDVSDLKNPDVVRGERPANIQVLSTLRAEHVVDNFDPNKKNFVCESAGPGRIISNTTHLPVFDGRSPSLLYMTWYDEGLRVIDLTNPFAPRFMGYFMSPRFGVPGREERQTREVFQDPATDLLYLTDGNGGGITVLRYTGPIPQRKPIPGAR